MQEIEARVKNDHIEPLTSAKSIAALSVIWSGTLTTLTRQRRG